LEVHSWNVVAEHGNCKLGGVFTHFAFQKSVACQVYVFLIFGANLSKLFGSTHDLFHLFGTSETLFVGRDGHVGQYDTYAKIARRLVWMRCHPTA
jgi:hypothetical protein